MNAMEATDALAGIIAGLRADNYHVQVVEASPSGLALSITALEDACAACLAPKAVMADIVSSALNGSYAPSQIAIEYPNDD